MLNASNVMVDANVEEITNKLDEVLERMFFYACGALTNGMVEDGNNIFRSILEYSNDLDLKQRVQMTYFYALYKSRNYDELLEAFKSTNLDRGDIPFSSYIFVITAYAEQNEMFEAAELARYLLNNRADEVSERDQEELSWLMAMT